MVNDVHRIAHDLEELHSHGYGISGGSALHAGLTLPSVAELGDTEETSSHEWTSRLRGILTNFSTATKLLPNQTLSSIFKLLLLKIQHVPLCIK